MPKRKIYVASSWRNPIQQDIVNALRSAGHEVYDFRNPAPGNKGFAWSEVNPDWLQWTPEQFAADLYSGHPAVVRGYGYDKAALDWCDTCVLVLPCGRSAHLEAGYAAGQGKLTLFYLHPDKFEPELMYLLGDGCVTTVDALLVQLEAAQPNSSASTLPAAKAIIWKVSPSGVKEMWVGRLLLGWMFFSHLRKCWSGRHIDGKLTDYASEADAKAAIEAVVLDA